MIRNKDVLNMVFEFCERNLYQEMEQRLAQGKNFNESEIKNIMFQATHAISYMHKAGYMHRDIKPENFLIQETQDESGSNNIQLKLADFG